MNTDDKIRPFYIAKLLYNLTDEDHYLTTSQIQELLKSKYGLAVHRQTIPKDIEILQQAGMDIQVVSSAQNRYSLVARAFDDAELKLLIDAAASAKFISKKKSELLAAKLAAHASLYRADDLKRNISVESRIKSDNEHTLLIIDAVNEAINQKKQIAFQYFRYNVRKRREAKWNGYWYHMSPYRLVWNGDYYYVIGYYEKYKSITSFRIDRMVDRPIILQSDALPMPKGFNLDNHINSMFRMYSAGTDRQSVQLCCENDIIDAMIDRFGKTVKTRILDPEHFEADVVVAVNSVFFSWVFGFEGKVVITGPDDVKERYAEMIRAAANKLE